jgi:hypothetical protein
MPNVHETAEKTKKSFCVMGLNFAATGLDGKVEKNLFTQCAYIMGRACTAER